jgi:hypothetical protein
LFTGVPWAIAAEEVPANIARVSKFNFFIAI